MIFGIIKKSFAQVNQNPAITLFFLIFLILISLFAHYYSTDMENIYKLIITICIFSLSAVFIGGWFKMFEEVAKDTKVPLAGVFFEGAGKNIIPCGILLILYIIASIIIIYCASGLSMKIFGNPIHIINDMASVSATQDKSVYLDFINNLSENDMLLLLGWQFVFVVSFVIYHFLVLFLPVTFIKSENKRAFLHPFAAICDNFVFIYKNFGFSILLYILFCLASVVMFVIKLVSSIHVVMTALYIILNVYFISYIVMIIFNCYEQKISCVDRPDSIGEDQSGDTISESE